MNSLLGDDGQSLAAPGLCLAFGGTNAREAVCVDGDIVGFKFEQTPAQPEEFFGWMARKILDTANAGNAWAAVGYPGPVNNDGHIAVVGPCANIAGLSQGQFDVLSHLFDADPAVERLINRDGFQMLHVNDGTLSAHAATNYADNSHDTIAALIIGTGIGTGIVRRDQQLKNVFRTDTSPNEIGHVIVGIGPDPTDTYENRYSGPALRKRHGMAPADMPASHLGWVEFARAIGSMTNILSVMDEVEVIVPCGGVGAGASEKYRSHLDNWMLHYARFGNKTQLRKVPELRFISPVGRDEFEMHGAEGAMLDHLTSQPA